MLLQEVLPVEAPERAACCNASQRAAQAAAAAGGNLVAMKAWDGGKSKLGVRRDGRVERTRDLSLKSRVFTVKGRVCTRVFG